LNYSSATNFNSFSMPGMHRTPISLEKPSASSKKNREQEAKGVNPVIEGKEPVSPPE
jgi:hypothetical protein